LISKTHVIQVGIDCLRTKLTKLLVRAEEIERA
jgi:hypothetical protein